METARFFDEEYEALEYAKDVGAQRLYSGYPMINSVTTAWSGEKYDR